MARAGGKRPAWVSFVELVCTSLFVPTTLHLYRHVLVHFFLLRGLIKWNGQLTAPILLNQCQNSTSKTCRKIPTRSRGEKKKKTPVLGKLLCSSLYTNGTTEHYTENVPTKWESSALIWPSPKYRHNFCCCCSKYTQLNSWIEEMVVGNWAESTGNHDSVTPLSPPAVKWL